MYHINNLVIKNISSNLHQIKDNVEYAVLLQITLNSTIFDVLLKRLLRRMLPVTQNTDLIFFSEKHAEQVEMKTKGQEVCVQPERQNTGQKKSSNPALNQHFIVSHLDCLDSQRTT